jgi:two-component system response regulator RegA
MTTGESILIVDDDETFRTRLVRAFVSRGYEARGAASAEEAIQAATEDSPELAVVDLRMPGASGREVVRVLHELDATTKVVVLTGYGSIATAVEAVRLGAVNYLTKPADADEILRSFAPGAATIETEPLSLARAEWEHIHRVLSDCGGNVSQAARLLGIHRRSLQRKLTKYPPR